MLHYEIRHLDEQADWVVFCHGLGGSSKIWYKQINEFQKHFNLLFIDFRGHGGSQDLPELEEYNHKEIAHEVLEVLDHLNIQKAHFAGISLGTIIIHSIMGIAPDRINSIMMGGAVTRFDLKSKLFLILGDVIKYLVPYMWIYKLFAWVLMPKKHHKKSREIFVREAKNMGQKEFQKWYKVVKTTNPIYRNIVGQELPFPKLYISGSEDYMFVKLLKKDIQWDPSSKLQLIQRCGHVCNIERHEEFNEISLRFLHEHSIQGLKIEA